MSVCVYWDVSKKLHYYFFFTIMILNFFSGKVHYSWWHLEEIPSQLQAPLRDWLLIMYLLSRFVRFRKFLTGKHPLFFIFFVNCLWWMKNLTLLYTLMVMYSFNFFIVSQKIFSWIKLSQNSCYKKLMVLSWKYYFLHRVRFQILSLSPKKKKIHFWNEILLISLLIMIMYAPQLRSKDRNVKLCI